MSEQSQLPGVDESQKPKHLIFLAAVPDASVIPQIRALTRQMMEQHGLTGKPIADERLHITLIELSEYVDLPVSLLDAISRAASTVSQPAFDVRFDQFERYPYGRNCVLTESNRSDGFSNVKQSLFVALKTEGVTRKKASAPHITLLYNREAVSTQRVDPVSWTVREFVLLHRRLDEKGGGYDVLARWPLQG
jgi:2'-5' RNA ligase